MNFSIIIIGFNQADTISAAISSALNQRGTQAEVIFVNDASTDASASLVEELFHGTDLKILNHSENQGPLISRLDGINAASGDYFLFLDGDDILNPDACSILAKVIASKCPHADMIGFGTELIYTSNVAPNTKKDIEALLTVPYLGRASGGQICRSTFISKEMSHVIWNKCYSAKLAHKLSKNLVYDRLMLGEDYYFSFVACSLCEEYYGIPNRLYKYSFGQGISTAASLSPSAYRRALTACKANQYCTEFAEKAGSYKTYCYALQENRKAGFLNCYYKLSLLPAKEKAAASEILFDTYGLRYALCTLAEEYWWNSPQVAEQINLGTLYPVKRKAVKTVAMFYHRLYNGGVERIISLLCELLSNAGYQLVVISDEPVNERDYLLPEGTVRLVISDGDQGRDYTSRFDQLSSCLKEYKVDAVLYHAWLSPTLFWDMCTVKSAGASFIIHAHSVFIAGLNEGWDGVFNYRKIFPQADTYVVLSEADKYFWSRYCNRVYSVNNPLTFRPQDIPAAALAGHTILWLGRFDNNAKNPGDALEIFKKVRYFVPDAKLCMAGHLDEKERHVLEEHISALGLKGCVLLPGYCSDVQSLFQESSVHLMTTNYEGFCMTLSESLATGVPVVTYELPYMTMAKDSGAVIQVPWRDTSAAAEAVTELLLDENHRRSMGLAGREELLKYSEYDYIAVWNEIFNSSITKSEKEESQTGASPADIVISTLELGLRQRCCFVQSEPSAPAPAGRVSRIKTLFRVLREKGLAYTIRLIRRKILMH